MMRSEIEAEVLQKVKPDEEEMREVNRVAQELKDELSSVSEGRFRPLLVGSVPKGTFHKDPDIDMFILFPEETPVDVLKEIGLKVGRQVLEDTEEKYAEHPYVHGRYKGFDTDIVPCFEVGDIEDMRSSVDRTPLHTEYVMAHLGEEQKDEVILLKAFLKGIGAYSAENKVQGFSGYLCELLILEYGDFGSLLEAGAGWDRGEELGPESENKAFDAPLTFRDPVDTDRNVASALSRYNFDLFRYASRSYLDHPSVKFFFPNPIPELSEEELKYRIRSRGTDFLDISIPRPDIVEDNLYPQMNKAHRALTDHLERKDFKIIHDQNLVTESEIHILFEFERATLPSIKKHQGPPVGNPHTASFEKKYGERIYIENGRLMVDRKRTIDTAAKAVEDAIKTLDLGSDLNDLFSAKSRISEDEKIAENYSDILSEFMDDRLPWKR